MIIRLGADPACDPTFVGPLTAEQSLICNLEAGISYRDALLAPDVSSPVGSGTGMSSTSLFLYAIIAVIALGFIRK
jgi:hypothetical protein